MEGEYMNLKGWIHAWTPESQPQQEALSALLAVQGLCLEPLAAAVPCGPGICLCRTVTPALCTFLHHVSYGGQERILVLVDATGAQDAGGGWELLQAGAADVLSWAAPEVLAPQVCARFARWHTIDHLLATPPIVNSIVGHSAVWRACLRDMVETAHFSAAPVLLLGESGTGKELIARLIHTLDTRMPKGDLVVLDCSTLQPELAGSEFFGHERGAYTGAVAQRDGAFALADGGTLFLDEVGELPLPLQAQLLRVVQEGTYKRVGGNTWYRTAFRLVCATNRDLRAQVHAGGFRTDLYYCIASVVCTLPPLRDRLDDVFPLVDHFLCQMHPQGTPPQMDDAVRTYLLTRAYPGNVRDLRQVVSRLLVRYAGGGMLTLGSVPPEERPTVAPEPALGMEVAFESVVRQAVLMGARLKDISRAAADAAIRIVTVEEQGCVRRAAQRLGVTDRTLQLRGAHRLHMKAN
jgi:transcriptional regulator with GAF, ATPase, and Fis domain